MQQFERPEERYREWGSECPACPHTPRFPLESRADAGEERHPPVHPPVLAHCSEPGSPLSHPMRAKAAGAKLWRSGPRRAGTAEGMKKLAGTAILFLAAPSSSPLYLCLSPAILSLSLSLLLLYTSSPINDQISREQPVFFRPHREVGPGESGPDRRGGVEPLAIRAVRAVRTVAGHHERELCPQREPVEGPLMQGARIAPR